MEKKRNVLVIDDEEKILEVLSDYLAAKGYSVETASTGNAGLAAFLQGGIDFVILDRMLPDLSGEEICEQIRACSSVPILMLTAKSMEEDLLYGFRIGADDYMTKPFSLKELSARMEAIFRRSNPICKVQVWEGGLEWNAEQMQVRKQGQEISLTPKEWRIFETLSARPLKVFTREELIVAAFGMDFDGYDRVIDTHIKNLRMKLEEDPKNPVYIQTMHGVGYRFAGEKR